MAPAWKLRLASDEGEPNMWQVDAILTASPGRYWPTLGCIGTLREPDEPLRPGTYFYSDWVHNFDTFEGALAFVRFILDAKRALDLGEFGKVALTPGDWRDVALTELLDEIEAAEKELSLAG